MGGLVLARSLGGRIVMKHGALGGSIVITVVEISGGQVKLHIVAPRAVSIHRSEVQERIDAGGARDQG